mmetsp:Transcript_814/g.1081  ORF Transcript_814/g.1081 Transcript_814/m.1081 type:complete len:370 (-) Transcript_814:221-1330(-)
MIRQIKINNRVDARNIQTARRHVGTNHNIPPAALELIQRVQTLRLGHLPVQTNRGEAEVTQHHREALDLVTSRREDEETLAGEFVYEVRQVHVLVLGGYEQVVLQQRLGRLELVTDLDLHGIAQTRALQFIHLRRHRRREQQRPPPSGTRVRQHFQNFINLLLEIHTQHPIRLVQNQIPHAPQMKPLRIRQMIQQPPRRRNHHVRQPRQRDSLRGHIHPPHDANARRADWFSERADDLVDLEGEFARGGEDEGVDGASGGGGGEEGLEEGEGEGAGFSGAGFGETDDVAAREGMGEGLGLDGGRDGPVKGFCGGEEGGKEAEGLECGGVGCGFVRVGVFFCLVIFDGFFRAIVFLLFRVYIFFCALFVF